jgi:hypothetical protein
MRSTILAMALLGAILAGAALNLAAAQDQQGPQATEFAPTPQPAPGAAYPGVPETDMTRLCARARRNGRAITRYFPTRAVEARRDGAVLLDCVIGDDGNMRTCQVLSEEPARWGFGDASLRIACHFHVDPATIVDNAPAVRLPEGSRYYRRNAEGEPWRVRVPVRFDVR